MMKAPDPGDFPAPNPYAAYTGVTTGSDYLGGSPYTSDPGMKFEAPEEWTKAINYWQSLLEGGGGGGGFGYTPEKVDIGKWWESQKPLQQRMWEEQSKQISEQGFTKGIGDSSMLSWQLNRGLQDLQQQLYAEAMEKQLQADMFNQQMAMQAAQAAAAAAAAAEAQRAAAAQALFGAGSAKLGAIGDIANMLGQSGQDLFNMENILAQQYNNPAILSHLGSFAGWGGGGGPATYQPSAMDYLSQISGMLPDVMQLFSKPMTPGAAGTMVEKAPGTFNPGPYWNPW